MKLAKKQEKFLKDLYVFYRALGGELDAGDFLMDLMKEDKDNDLNWFYAEALIEIDRLEIDRTTLTSHKDVLNMGVDGKNLSEGEYYTPLIWAEKGRNIIKETYPDLYGTAYIWDVACGTGNLLVESGYPQDKIIMSTLNQSDVDLVKGLLPEATVFQLDFLNLVDLDKDNNYFSSQLPEKVRKILENNEPLIIYMNPPYVTFKADTTDVGVQLCNSGYKGVATSSIIQFYHRIIMLKATYSLTNLVVCAITSASFLYSNQFREYLSWLRSVFEFKKGFCFTMDNFHGTSTSVDWLIVTLLWGINDTGVEDTKLITLDKLVNKNNVLEKIGEKHFRETSGNCLIDWVQPNDVMRYKDEPVITNTFTFDGNTRRVPENAIGHYLIDREVKRSVRRFTVSSYPFIDGVAITEENLGRIIWSYGFRELYNVNAFDNSGYFLVPNFDLISNEDKENLFDMSLLMFLFSRKNVFASYREGREGSLETRANSFFPLTKDEVLPLLTDTVLIEDLKNNPAGNSIIVELLKSRVANFSEVNLNFYNHCMEIIKDSLTSDYRSSIGYKNGLDSWDASLKQIFTTWEDREKFKEYTRLRNLTKDVFTGFLEKLEIL